MAFTFTELASKSQYSTKIILPSFTSTTGRLLLLSIARNTLPTSISSEHGTWTLIDSITGNSQLSALYALITTATVTDTLTVNFANATTGRASVVEVEGSDITNIATAIPQSNTVSQYNGGGGPFTCTVPLSAFASSTNATFITAFASTATAEAGYTTLTSLNVLFAAGIDSEDTTPSFTTTQRYKNKKAVAIEIQEVSVAGFPDSATLLGDMAWPSVSSSHSNLVAVIKYADFTPAMLTALADGGGTLRVSKDAAGVTRLPIEVVEFDKVGLSAQVWVKDPTAATGEKFYIWNENVETTQPAVTDAYGRNAVWSDYDGVFHFNELSGAFIDATGNGNNITPADEGTITRGVSMPTGKGVSLSGGNTSEIFLKIADSSNTLWNKSLTTYTIQAWANRGVVDVSGPNSLFGFGDSTKGGSLYYRNGPNTLHYGSENGSSNVELDSTTTFTEGSANFAIGGVYNSGAMTLLVNGSSEATGTNGTSIPTQSGSATVASAASGSIIALKQWSGNVNEVRRSTLALSNDYILTEYQNQSTTGAYFISTDAGGGALTVLPVSITSAEAFGTPTIQQPKFILPVSIVSAEAFGTPTIQQPKFILPVSIVSTEAFGTPTILQPKFIFPVSIVSTEAFGIAIIIGGVVIIADNMGNVILQGLVEVLELPLIEYLIEDH